MKFSFLICNLIFLFFFSGCSKKAQPETTLNRDGENESGLNDAGNGFNNGVVDLAGLGDPLRGDFGDLDPLAPRDTALSAFVILYSCPPLVGSAKNFFNVSSSDISLDIN